MLRLVPRLVQQTTLDRRKGGRRMGAGQGRQLGAGQGGIAGVDYDTIYLSIGVAATALFIIETLYKVWQLYSGGGGRALGGQTDLLLTSQWEHG